MNRYTDDIIDDEGNVHRYYHGLAHEIPDEDDRHQKWRESRDKKFGYDSTCLFSLDTTLASMIAVHLDNFKSNTNHHPSILSEDEWGVIMDKIEEGFRLYSEIDEWDSSRIHNENMMIVNEAQELFHKYFFSLWI